MSHDYAPFLSTQVTLELQRKGEADIKATVQNVSSRDEVKLFEYRRQVDVTLPLKSHSFNPLTHENHAG